MIWPAAARHGQARQHSGDDERADCRRAAQQTEAPESICRISRAKIGIMPRRRRTRSRTRSSDMAPQHSRLVPNEADTGHHRRPCHFRPLRRRCRNRQQRAGDAGDADEQRTEAEIDAGTEAYRSPPAPARLAATSCRRKRAPTRPASGFPAAPSRAPAIAAPGLRRCGATALISSSPNTSSMGRAKIAASTRGPPKH